MLELGGGTEDAAQPFRVYRWSRFMVAFSVAASLLSVSLMNGLPLRTHSFLIRPNVGCEGVSTVGISGAYHGEATRPLTLWFLTQPDRRVHWDPALL